MTRREFITLLGGAAAAWPVTVRAQPADRRPLVGYLVETTKEAHASRIAAFLEGMRDLGYVEGQNVEIAYRFGNFDRARVPALADELVRLSPHLIFAADPIAVLVVKSARDADRLCAAHRSDQGGTGQKLGASRWCRHGHIDSGRWTDGKAG
jgi:putative ABC transport system substrate-binding protein